MQEPEAPSRTYWWSGAREDTMSAVDLAEKRWVMACETRDSLMYQYGSTFRTRIASICAIDAGCGDSSHLSDAIYADQAKITAAEDEADRLWVEWVCAKPYVSQKRKDELVARRAERLAKRAKITA